MFSIKTTNDSANDVIMFRLGGIVSGGILSGRHFLLFLFFPHQLDLVN